MMLKSKLFLTVFTSTLVISASNVSADESMLSLYEHLDDDTYVLFLPGGSFIRNTDGSANFLEEQLDSSKGGEVIKVSEAKKRVVHIRSDEDDFSIPGIYEPYKNVLNPSRSWVVGPGQQAEAKVSGSGWRYSPYYYHPSIGTGAYLLWETYGDSGVAGETAIYPGVPRYIFSDTGMGTYTWGIRYKTYNAPAGTRFTASNW